jgi:light-regulated signal transduction histidine kinase (bacteriophytochrome)
MGQTLCCLAISIYFAVDQERIRRSLSQYNAHVAESCRKIGKMNRELENRVAARETLLESANAQLESFCESAAASLRPSLGSIGEHMDALRRLPVLEAPADSSALLNRVGNAAVRMGETLEVLLDYVALGRRPMRVGPINLSQEAEKRVQRLRELEPGRRVEVIVHDGMLATGDAVMLPEALRHLIDNAWKFTVGRPDAWIEIGTRATTDGQRQFYVGDNGMGFDMANVGNLFRPFMRLQAVESLGGHGMGLARSARIIGRHAGSIQGEAGPGMGAEFCITLGKNVAVPVRALQTQ